MIIAAKTCYMLKQKRLMPQFYEFTFKKIINKIILDLPRVEKDAEILKILSFFRRKYNSLMIKNKESKKLVKI